MKLKKYRYSYEVGGQTNKPDIEVDRIEFEVGNEEYIITEEHEGFFSVQKVHDFILLKPGCSNQILIK